MTFENSNDIVVYHSQQKMRRAALQSLVFVILAVPILLLSLSKHGIVQILYIALALLDALFFGACLFYAVKRLRVSTPALIIGKDGIFDDSSSIGAGKVAWTDIASAHIGAAVADPCLCLVPRDINGFLRRHPFWKRRLMQANIRMLGAPIVISAIALPISIDELKSSVDGFLAVSE